MRPLPLRAALASVALASTTAFAAAMPQLAQAQPAPSPAPTSSSSMHVQSAPQAPEDPTVTARAKDIMHRVQTGTVDRSQLSDDYNKQVTDKTLSDASSELAALGEPRNFQYFGKLTQGDVTAYVYRVQMERGVVDELIAFDPSNKIVRLLFRLRPTQSDETAPNPAGPNPGAPNPAAPNAGGANAPATPI